MKKLSYLFTICLITLISSVQAQNCGAYFTYSGTGTTINFSDTSWLSAGNIMTYAWTFGDGSSATTQNPTHTYSQNGTYVVCLSITTTLGCRSSYCDSIVVGNSPAACQTFFNYWADTTNTAHFTSYVSSGTAPYTYSWDFGDNVVSTSTQANPSYTYSSAGAYVVSLTVTDASGNSCFAYDTVYVNYCSAYFSSRSNGGGTYTFSNHSSAPPFGTIYTWNFGDGNSTVTTGNASHTYTSSGVYQVTLTLFDSLNNCQSSFSDSVNVMLNNPCQADFTYWVDSLNTVHFTNLTFPSNGFTYSWNFGDNSAGSNAANPLHSYNSPGSYVVTLTAIGNGVSCSTTIVIQVNYCNASFTSTQAPGGAVIFTNTSSPATGPHVYYTWNFGDGSNTVSTVNPTHTYSASGTYTVSLTVYDSLNNCISTVFDSINVSLGQTNNCNASYTVALDSSAAFRVILYNTSSNFNSHVYTWDFGDGTTGSGRTPQHQYLSFGSYVVCLTITDPVLRCTDTFCDTVGMDTLGNLKSGFGITVVDPLTVGIDEEKSIDNLSIFPNPASSIIQLDLRGLSERMNIKMMDLSGRVIEERKNQQAGNVEVFDISSLKNGFYFLMIDNGKTQKVEKFIKAE